MPRDDIALFIDLETTGSDKTYDEIIEIGISAIDLQAEGYPEIASYSHVRLPSDPAFIRMMGKKVVREMHEKNGLLKEVLEGRDSPDATFWNSQRTQELNSWLEDTLGYEPGKIPEHVHWGGSGVMHFDRPFITKTYPYLDARLAYYAAYDISSTRRQFTKAGVTGWPDQDAGKTHRALDDARFHADEFRWSQEYIRGR